jgi:hypothetical protein
MGASHITIKAHGAGRERTDIWNGREGLGRSRVLQSEPVLHSNQRCGGCAAAVNHPHKGPPAPFPLSGLRTSLPTPSSERLGSAKRLGLGGADPPTGGTHDTPSKFKQKLTEWGHYQAGWVLAPWRLKRERERQRDRRGRGEMEERGQK